MQIGQQPFGDWHNRLRAVSDLQGDDAAMIRRRVGRDVGEIAIQRDEDGIQFLPTSGLRADRANRSAGNRGDEPLHALLR